MLEEMLDKRNKLLKHVESLHGTSGSSRFFNISDNQFIYSVPITYENDTVCIAIRKTL